MNKEMTITEAILNRHSTYPDEFTGEMISDDTIKTLLELANRAPTHKKTEPWRFKVVIGAGKERLGEFFKDVYTKNTPADEFDSFKSRKLKKKVDKSSHVLILCMQKDILNRLPEWEEVAAMSCAVQNLWLAAQSHGIGGYWSSPKFYMDHIENYISLDEGEKCMGFFYLGVPQELDRGGSTKGPWEDKVSWITK